jgi:hypothetical protein
MRIFHDALCKSKIKSDFRLFGSAGLVDRQVLVEWRPYLSNGFSGECAIHTNISIPRMTVNQTAMKSIRIVRPRT